MTYRNVRAFPRGTGAGALRETVHLTDAENAACQLLEHLNWHGMAELDFRVGDDGVPYLIELNPRFFGGLHQAIAANVDYPHLLFRIAAGETIEQAPRADETVRTEAPVIGLLATLDEIAHDERVLERLRHVRDAAGSDRLNPEDSRLKSFFRTLREAANPKDVKAYVNEMFEKHHGAINDVLQSDDPRPVLGMMFPVVMMLKHGRISMGVITGEEDAGSPRPRRRFRDMLMHPTWTTLLLTATLYALSVFTTNADITRDNIGWVFGLPGRVAELVAGRVEPDQMGTIGGAIRHTCYHALNLFFWYLIAARLRRERPSET
jgi:hypothetical protein